MLPDGSIEVSHLWKRFRTDRKIALVREHARRLSARIRGDHTSNWRWALRDVNLSIAPGEAVGLVGANGSGKTTLLKILSGVMYPYAGSVQVAGRVGALIEVRAGIHPELTGRENVYIYGTLLGLSRKATERRFDEIVEFAELGDAIDRQLKFYSSGMQMRLGFAVAVYLEPSILLVDEILAVGDATFQQKCLERMREVLSEGTTLLFVSHDLASVEATCQRAIWLRNGVIEGDGPVRDVVNDYRRSVEEYAEYAPTDRSAVRLTNTVVEGEDGAEWVRTQGPLEMRFNLENVEGKAISGHFVVGVTQGTATPIFVLHRELLTPSSSAEVRCSIPSVPLPKGRYYVWASLWHGKRRDIMRWHPVAHFDVHGEELGFAPPAIVRLAPVYVGSEWEVESTNGSPAPARDRTRRVNRATS